MSLKAIKVLILCAKMNQRPTIDEERAAEAEITALEKAAKDLTRLSIGDGVYRVRDSEKVLSETADGHSTWEHPDVKAWSDASVLLTAIAKDAE